jgi:hypothetical protein
LDLFYYIYYIWGAKVAANQKTINLSATYS